MSEKLIPLKTKAKCQYVTVNTSDTESLRFENAVINHTDIYTYLGTMIENASIVKQIS